MEGDVVKLSANTTINAIELELVPVTARSQSAPTGNGGREVTTTRVGLFLDINVPGESLVPGRYQIQFYKPGAKDTISQTFDIIWDNMPLSLRNSRYAAESMYFILTDEEHQQLTRGSEDERLNQKFTLTGAKMTPHRKQPLTKTSQRIFNA